MGYCDKACTDIPCAWTNDFTKKVTPLPVCEIQLYKQETKTKAQSKSRRKDIDWPVASDSEQTDLLKRLKKCDIPPVGLSLFENFHERHHYKAPVPEKTKLPTNLRNLYKENCDNVNEIVGDFMNNKLSDATLELVELATRAQSLSLHWHSMRTGRITASNAFDCVKGNVDSPAKSTVMRITNPSTGKDLSNIPAVKWGRDNEAVALKKYVAVYENQHSDFSVEKTGLRLHPEYNFIGATADGVAKCSCHGAAVVEIKCPYNSRFATEPVDLKVDCLDQKGLLIRSHKYFFQIQLQMLVYGLKIAHFVLWTPKLIVIQEVTQNIPFQDEMIQKLCTFYSHVIGPELVTRKLENTCIVEPQSTPSLTQENDNSDGVKCICNGKYDGNRAIGCDCLECDVGWYHKSCVRIKRTPKGKWYCAHCKKSKRALQN